MRVGPFSEQSVDADTEDQKNQFEDTAGLEVNCTADHCQKYTHCFVLKEENEQMLLLFSRIFQGGEPLSEDCWHGEKHCTEQHGQIIKAKLGKTSHSWKEEQWTSCVFKKSTFSGSELLLDMH